MLPENLLRKRYPNLGEAQIENILEAYKDGFTWYHYNSETHAVILVNGSRKEIYRVSVDGYVEPVSIDDESLYN